MVFYAGTSGSIVVFYAGTSGSIVVCIYIWKYSDMYQSSHKPYDVSACEITSPEAGIH